MVTLDELRALLAEVLDLGPRGRALELATPLLGALPELDSVAVLALIAAMEERFCIRIEDDEVGAETFATLGSLHDFVIARQLEARAAS